MSALRLAVRQVGFESRAFWRNPAAAGFTFVFPILLLFIFTTIFDDFDTATLPTGVEVGTSTYYTATLLAFSVVTACFTNVAMTVSFARDEGVLKRVRGTPLPGVSYLLGKMLHSIVIMAILVVIVSTVGVIAYDIDVPTTSLPAFVVTLLVGSASMCALGLACTIIVPNAEAGPAVINGIVFPLLFISGVFIPVDDSPGWLQALGNIFPVKPFLEAAIESFIPTASNEAGWSGGNLLVVAAWGVAALLAAARWFSWEPRR